MRILFLTHYYTPDITSNAVIATELARHLAQMGHRVTVVTSVPHYDTQEIPPAYRRVIIRRSIEAQGRLSIWHTWVYVPRNKRSTLQRFLSYFSYNLMSGLLSPFLGRHDIVLTLSPPLTNGVVAFLVSALWRAPFIYSVQDLFPDLPVELGLIKNRWLIGLLYRLERFVYRRAAALTALSDSMARRLLDKGLPQSKVVTIPNFVDVDFVSPREKDNPWARQHNLHEKFVVMYTGNIGSAQSVDVLVHAASLLRDAPGIRVAIVGDGAAKGHLVQQAADLKLDNITFLPLQPREAVPDLFAAGDLLLVSLRKGVAEHSVPSKAYTIMASARPILASVEPGNAVREIVEKADCGYYVPAEDPAALADVVRQVAANPALGREKGANGRRFVVEHYSVTQVAQQYHALMTELTTK